MKVLAFVNTEYHLLLVINEILSNKDNHYDVFLCKESHGKRLNIDFDFSGLDNAKFAEVDTSIDLEKPLQKDQRDIMLSFAREDYGQMVFFQQHDAYFLALLRILNQNNFNGVISLFQDGLKPYNELKGHSFGILKFDYSVHCWLRSSEIKGYQIMDFINSAKYAYNKEIDTVNLTFPLAYRNWNNKKVEQIKFVDHHSFKAEVEKVFRWDNRLLPFYEDVIFYLSQPTGADSKHEVNFIQELKSRLKKHIIIKLHPLTSDAQAASFESIANDIQVIHSQIPAEIFIMNLRNSIAVALNSTSFFYFTPGNKYYYTSNMFQDKIRRLRRYKFSESPAKHIVMPKRIEEIT